MIKDETINSEMINKVNEWLTAVKNGVTAGGIITGTKQQSCWERSFSDDGEGKWIRKGI